MLIWRHMNLRLRVKAPGMQMQCNGYVYVSPFLRVPSLREGQWNGKWFRRLHSKMHKQIMSKTLQHLQICIYPSDNFKSKFGLHIQRSKKKSAIEKATDNWLLFLSIIYYFELFLVKHCVAGLPPSAEFFLCTCWFHLFYAQCHKFFKIFFHVFTEAQLWAGTTRGDVRAFWIWLI